jgi:hypothetical protein
MKVVALTPPGRFPTVDHDPGLWWGPVASAHEAVRFSANAAWWRALCRPSAHGRLRPDLTWAQRLRHRLELSAAGLPFGERARAAGAAIADLCGPRPYARAEAFVAAASRLNEFLEAVNAAGSGLTVDLGQGPRAAGVDYADSGSLADYALCDGPLAATVEASLDGFPADAGFVAFSVTSAEDLLTAMIAARLLRRRLPGAHLCLADHGYENFSLSPHLEGLRRTGRLLAFFDTVVEAKDERDGLVPALAAAHARGRAPRGFVSARSHPGLAVPVRADGPVPPADDAFGPERVFWTRVSPRRCYWSRCAFCAQNNKYDDPRPPSKAELGPVFERLAALRAAGTRTFIFSDEALSPALLRLLAAGIIERGLDIRWACRSKLELSHTPELFELLARAGCYEVLYGLESISMRVQELMDKRAPGLDAAAIRRIFEAMGRAGVGTHVNLIGAFPGDTVAEVSETVDFLVDVLPEVDNATFLLNQFALFPDTPALLGSARFGLVPEPPAGDMPSAYAFAVAEGGRAANEAVVRELPRLRAELSEGLGWGSFGRGEGAAAALALYFGSGLGAVMKARPGNPFANPARGAAGAGEKLILN